MKSRLLIVLAYVGVLALMLGSVPGAVAAPAGVDFSIQPPAQTVDVGQVFTVDILVDARTQEVDVVEAYVDFDITYLKVVDAHGDIIVGMEEDVITPGLITETHLTTRLMNRVDNVLGRADIAYGMPPGGTPAKELFVLGTIHFKALAETTDTALAFRVAGLRTTMAIRAIIDVTGARTAGTVVITPPADIIPPTVISVSPKDTDVPIDTNIAVTFSEAMYKPSAETAFTIDPAVDGAFSWINHTMTFTPVANLSYETTYTVTIGTGATDLAGNQMVAPYSWPFTTAVAPPLPRYTLTVTVAPPESGTVSLSPVQPVHGYEAGTVVTLTATPASGYVFSYWSGDASGTAITTSVTMDAHKTVTANFSEITHTLSMAVIGSGTTIPAVGVHVYPAGTVVDIIATPDAGWQFVNWTGDVADADSATTTVTMNADKTVTANFTVMPIKINEFVSNPADDQVEWIELYNPTATEVDLTGWTIEDGTGSPASLEAKAIPAGGYLILQQGANKDFAFVLNNPGDIIILKSGDTEVDRVTFGNWNDGDTAANAPVPGKGESAGRYPNGVDTGVDSADFVVFTVPTPGDANVPSIAFIMADYTVREGEGIATIMVHLSLMSKATVSVDYTTRDGTATAPDDYTVTSGTLEIIPNMVGPHVFHVPIVDDDIAEGNETIILELSNPRYATLGTPSTAVLTITDDDVVTVAFSSATYTIDEDGGSATIIVNLSAVSPDTVTVHYTTTDVTTTAGLDYEEATGTLTFAPDETSKEFTVTILNDDLVEGDETLNLTLSNETNAILGTPAAAVLTIIDDEMPEVMFDSATYTVAEDGGNATITVMLSEATLNTVTVEYATSDGTATAPDDYTAVSGTLTFNPNETSKTFTVPIIDDPDVEGGETVNLALTEPDKAALGTPAAAVLTITDDEMPEVMFDSATYTVDEDGVEATITVVLSQATRNTVTVEYDTIAGGTATAADYTAVHYGTLIFAPGVTSQDFTVAILDDDIAEGNETIILELELSYANNAGLGTPYQAVLTIRDDESWLFGWSHVALIAPHPARGREVLTVVEPVALTAVNYDGPADGWFQVLWFDETYGTWYAFKYGFTEGNTLTHLYPGEFYLVVVSHPDTSLWIEEGWDGD